MESVIFQPMLMTATKAAWKWTGMMLKLMIWTEKG